MNECNMKDEAIELSTSLSPKDEEPFDTTLPNLEALLKEYEMLFAKVVELEKLYEDVLKEEAEEHQKQSVVSEN